MKLFLSLAKKINILGRFRPLLETNRTDLLPLIIICGCILHNICISNGDDFRNELNMENKIAEERMMGIYKKNLNGNNQRERVKRNLIANNLPLLNRFNH